MYKHVLLAYDGTLEGARALREGALLANTCRSKVMLLSVVPENAGTRTAESAYAGLVAQQVDEYKALLARAVERLKALGFNPSARLVVGEAAPTIGAVAKEISADLVVVGHHRQTFLSRWWSGSTDAYLSDHVHCSLLFASNGVSDDAFETEVKSAGVVQS
jgi:nucleotide-binding universal stress UspA family protein